MKQRFTLIFLFCVLIAAVALGAGVFYARNFSAPATMVPATGAPTPTQPANENVGRCIITVFNQQYDVTDLRDTHTGGDVFACGTDMSAVYQKQHGTNTRMIERYLVK